MQTFQKIRINQQTACQLLDLSREGLRKLIKKDPTFPRPIKEGTHIQAPVYFDYQSLLNWHNTKCQTHQTAANDVQEYSA